MYIFSGEEVDIPNVLKQVPKFNKPIKGFVWTKMIDRASAYLGDNIHKVDKDSVVMDFSNEDMLTLLQGHNIPISEYLLFRFLWKWCKIRGQTANMHKFLRYIDFARMTHQQRHLAAIDLNGVPNLPETILTNGLNMSEIMNARDIQVLEGDASESFAWHMFSRMQSDEFSWNILNEILAKDVYKLILFKV